MTLLAMLDDAEQALLTAERELGDAERQLGAPGVSWEVATAELTHAQVKANVAATKCMAIAARLLVTTRHGDAP